MRGTIHFVPARDAAWMLSLGAARRLAVDAPRRSELGLDAEVLDRSERILRQELHGGGAVARPLVLHHLERAGIRTDAQRGYHILLWLAQRGVICLGPLIARQPGIALLDEWVSDARVLSRTEALGTLALRYFASHGPATIHDFAHWTGLTMADVRAAHESIRPSLVMQAVNGAELWALTDEPPSAIDPRHRMHLLPGFDEFLLGYRDRGAQITPQHAPRITPGNNGVFRPMIVERGEVTGCWAREFRLAKGHPVGVRLRLEFFAGRNRPQKLIEAACSRVAEFLGTSLEQVQVAAAGG
jgi:hypothetical protein